MSAQTWVAGSSAKIPSRFVVGPNKAPHHLPWANQSFDWAVLVVGDRTTSASTAKSGNVIPAVGGGTTPSLARDAVGPTVGSGPVGVAGLSGERHQRDDRATDDDHEGTKGEPGAR